MTLGAASYAIYLIHTPANAVVQRAAAYLPRILISLGAGHVLLIVTGVAAGIVRHRVAERPIVSALHRHLFSPGARRTELRA